jgi:carboxyl-terminal processing protease
MKRSLLILFISAIFNLGFSQTSDQKIQNLATLGKVWGFLKYYHPKVANAKYDWDKELLKKLPLIKSTNSKEAINKIYIDWIKSLGEIKKNNHKCDTSAMITKNLDLAWLNDSIQFNNDLIQKLNFIKENRAKHHYYFRSKFTSKPFGREKTYKDSLFPSEGFRLMGLFRYWNIINYYFPYKYKTDEDWNEVLEEMIPAFLNSKDTVEYNLAMLLLTTKINDSHAFFNTKFTAQNWGNYYPPFRYKIIDNKAIITDFWNDTLAKENDIRNGDVILRLNTRELAEVIKERLYYIGASNEPTKLLRLSGVLFKSKIDSCLITFERNGQISDKYIKLYRHAKFHYKWHSENGKVCSLYADSIGYVNMGLLKRKQVDSVMKIMKNKIAIIFDIRNYPHGTMYAISRYLNKDVQPFAKLSSAYFQYPGVFRWNPTYYCGKKKKIFGWIPTYAKGAKNNDDYFKGKVVLLFNESTQSHAEFTCMALKTAPDVKCIGSQTAGADGDVSLITFPGGYKTYMTGMGVYYPNGNETQRIGIVPDIEIKPTIEGMINKRDEVLERAIRYIHTGY